MVLKFSSSWRPDTTGGNQTGLVMASYDGSEPVVISRWDSVENGLYYKRDSLSERVVLPINNPNGAQSVVLSFQLKDAGNTWWWAIDDVELVSRYYDVNLLGFGVANIEVEAFRIETWMHFRSSMKGLQLNHLDSMPTKEVPP